MLGRLIPIAAVKSESAVPSYPLIQNTRSAASNAVSGSKARGRPRWAPVDRAADLQDGERAPRLFSFVSFFTPQHLITLFRIER